MCSPVLYWRFATFTEILAQWFFVSLTFGEFPFLLSYTGMLGVQVGIQSSHEVLLSTVQL